MSDRKLRADIETGEMRAVGRASGSEIGTSQKGRTASRSLTIFKSLVLTILMVITLYGMLNRGLFVVDLWLPVAVAILGVVFITLFVADYFADVPRIIWVLVGLLVVLVTVKGLSLTWSISRTETVQELLRSSMYLAAFALAAASLSSWRLVGPFLDGMSLIAGAVAGYGVLQKVNSVDYSSNTPDGLRVGSTLEYANTVAVVLGMGIALGLGRMTQLKNPIARGLYAVLILVFGTVLYLTFSRGGMLSLAAGLVVLFAVSGRRLEMFGSLLLVSGPLLWLVWQVQGLDTFFGYVSEEAPRAADGLTFRNYLIVAVIQAFLLQTIYAFLVRRYELMPTMRRVIGAATIVAVLAGAGILGYVIYGEQEGSKEVLGAFARNTEGTQDVQDRLMSLSSNSRSTYWRVAWDEWKERPLLGTGAGTFQYTWLENRPGFGGVRQVHNLYLEQGTETGVVAFVALSGFAVILLAYTMWATFRASPGEAGQSGERKVLLAGLTGAVAVYLFSSALEWHWYIPSSTIYFFILAGVAVKLATRTRRPLPDEVPE
ncbi:MAG: O-antigen ligase family protein [Actinomycetota bacterium]|nr:O-antigen ligase family protein [Actinomycetota bacterium]